MIDEELKEPWHVSKGVSVGHIISTIAFVIMALSQWSAMDIRVSVLESKYSEHIKQQITAQAKQEVVNKEILTEIKGLRREIMRYIAK